MYGSSLEMSGDQMKQRKHYFAYLLIAVGFYFFITQFNHPLIDWLHSWPVLLIGIGLWLTISHIKDSNRSFLFEGLVVVLVGIHFYGLLHLSNWPNDWSIFPFIFGLALFLAFVSSKKHLFLSLALILLSVLFFYVDQLPNWVPLLRTIEVEIQAHWPVIIIMVGILLVFYKRK